MKEWIVQNQPSKQIGTKHVVKIKTAVKLVIFLLIIAFSYFLLFKATCKNDYNTCEVCKQADSEYRGRAPFCKCLEGSYLAT